VTLDHFSQRAKLRQSPYSLRLLAFAGSLLPALSRIGDHHERTKTSETQAQLLRDATEGMKDRQPKADQELNERLASDE